MRLSGATARRISAASAMASTTFATSTSTTTTTTTMSSSASASMTPAAAGAAAMTTTTTTTVTNTSSATTTTTYGGTLLSPARASMETIASLLVSARTARPASAGSTRGAVLPPSGDSSHPQKTERPELDEAFVADDAAPLMEDGSFVSLSLSLSLCVSLSLSLAL